VGRRDRAGGRGSEHAGRVDQAGAQRSRAAERADRDIAALEQRLEDPGLFARDPKGFDKIMGNAAHMTFSSKILLSIFDFLNFTN
jgi:hypothetical protein